MKNQSSNPIEDIQAIRNIMERSSKFLSLSGLAGIFAGACALSGAVIAVLFILPQGTLNNIASLRGDEGSVLSRTGWLVAVEGLLILLTSFAGAVYFFHRKAVKANLSLWTTQSRQMLIHLLIPLTAGGFFVLILLLNHKPELAASAMLVFYGLSLVNAGKFTLGEIHYLGLTEIILGLLAGFYPQAGLLLWAAGFGLMHILYGTAMYYRHER